MREAAFIEMLRRAAESDGDDGENHRLSETQIEAQIADLQEFVDRYTKPCPFKVGDLVTARSYAPIKGKDIPHVVVDVLETPIFEKGDRGHGSNNYGARLDIRVACFVGDDLAMHWVESIYYEPWKAL